MEKFTFNTEDTNYVSSFAPVPSWMSEEAIKTLNQGYLLPGECPRDLYYRVACQSARLLDRPEIMRDIFDILYQGFLGLSTPVASNFGSGRGLPIACYGDSVSDSIPSIFSHLKEVAMMSKNGGGVASFYGNIRPAGSNISDGGISTGIVPVVQQYDKCAGYVSQGNTRRGSLAHYLPIDHPDAYELMLAKDHLNGDPRKMVDGNIAFTVTDEFMYKVLAGDKEASKLFGKALETNLKVGSPYFLFIDNVNKANPASYINHNLKVETSNLCLTGDTLVATSQGNYFIKDLVNKTVNIFDGLSWVSNSSFNYKGKSKVITIELNSGEKITSTIYHKNPCYFNYNDLKSNSFSVLRTEDLRIGMYLMSSRSLLDSFSEKERIETSHTNQIVSIELHKEEQDVYCTSVPSTSYFALGNDILTGNCSEITLFTDESHSFVCCLSSLNLAKWDEWKNWKSTNTNKTVVELSIYLLDSVIEEFIKRAKPMVGMGRAVRSAEKGRALGLGSMGLAYLYQLKNLPFKSKEARSLNIEIHKYIKEYAFKASKDLALEYGEPEWCKGTGMRNSHLTAVAPTRTNSVITGAFSAGIEPIDSNAYTAKQAKGSFTRKNPLLVKLLQEKELDAPETWEHILQNNGSVLYLDSLSIDEKLVFLTAREIDQEELIRQAADRAPYICQGQSLNRFVHPNIPLKQLSELVFKAWKSGVKSTYYTKSSSEQVLAKVKNKATIISKENCPYCEKTKKLFDQLSIDYIEYKREDVKYFPWKTVPQIWYEGHFIGGYSELLEYTAKLNKTMPLLKSDALKFSYEHTQETEDCVSCSG